MRNVLALFFWFLAVTAAADERSAFYGAWGAAEQCARTPILPGGTVMSRPFEIGAEWLRHGEVWCRLTWFPVERRADGLFTGAHAQCGEDAVRDYLLGMTISGDSLTLRWDFQLVGPLSRCPGA